MKPAESASALKVQAVLGDRFEVLEFDASTRTAADAAAAIGCEVAQIAKSLIFRGGTSGRAVLIIASGVDRVDEKKAAAAVGEPIARADADFVREATGFAIGGVPPVGHKTKPIVLIEESLLQFRRNLGCRRHAQRGLSLDAGGPRRTDRRTHGRGRAQSKRLGRGCKGKRRRKNQDRRRRLDVRAVARRVLSQGSAAGARARICGLETDLDRDQRHLLRLAEAGELHEVA